MQKGEKKIPLENHEYYVLHPCIKVEDRYEAFVNDATLEISRVWSENKDLEVHFKAERLYI